MTDRKHILVLYHANCTDGWTAAWAAWKKFGDSAEYLPATYQSGEVFDVAGREVYFLDYCPEPHELQNYRNFAESIVVLDHHKSAKEACDKFDFSSFFWDTPNPPCSRFDRFFDLARSGAHMAWDYFHPGKECPALVDYVEDRDLWRWLLPHSRTISSALSSYAHGDFALWSSLADQIDFDGDDLINEGRAIERVRAIDIAAYKQNSMRGSFAGHQNVPIVNVAGNIVSEVLNELATKDFFAVGWSQMSDGVFRYSLRSKGDFDVAAIAARFGGGGHKNAAGFSSPLPPWAAEMTHGEGVLVDVTPRTGARVVLPSFAARGTRDQRMTTNAEMMERKEEYILRGSAPKASPRTYDTLEDAEEALRDAMHDWPQHHHRLVLRVTRVEEIELRAYAPPRRT